MSIASESALKEWVDTFNRMNAMVDEAKKAGEILLLHLYETKAENLAFYALRCTHFQKTLKSNSPKLEPLPLGKFY